MIDPFKYQARSRQSPASQHFAIVPSDSTDLPIRPRVLYCAADGTAMVRDGVGNDLSYSLLAGDILPISAVRVLATGTTATLYGWI